MIGREVMREELGRKEAGLHQHEINMERMSSGMYIHEIAVDETWRRQKKWYLSNRYIILDIWIEPQER